MDIYTTSSGKKPNNSEYKIRRLSKERHFK